MPAVGGEIALKPEHGDEDRLKAQSMMTTNCATAAVKVLEEGEVVAGETTQSNASQTQNQGQNSRQVGTLFGIPVTPLGQQASNDTATSATTTAVKESNIRYSRGK